MTRSWIVGGALRDELLGREVTDIDIAAREILRMKQRLNEILQTHTGQSLEKIEKDTDRDYFLSGEQAVEYGIIDQVVHDKQAFAKQHGKKATDNGK